MNAFRIASQLLIVFGLLEVGNSYSQTTHPATPAAGVEQRARLVRDDENDSAAASVVEQSVKRSQSLKIKLGSGGGFLARFTAQ